MKLTEVVELLKERGEIGQPPLRHGCDELFVLLSRDFHLQVLLILVGSTDVIKRKIATWKSSVEEMLAETLDELEGRLKISKIQADLDVFVALPEVDIANEVLFAETLPVDQIIFQDEFHLFPASRCGSVEPLAMDVFKRLSEILFPKREWRRVAMAMDGGRLVRHEQRRELDRNQINAAWGLGFESTLIEGGPGTGKSLVLISRALWLANALPNSKILLLTWNSSLAEALGVWLRTLKREVPLASQGEIEIVVFADFLKQQRIEISLSDPLDADRRCSDLLKRTRFKPLYDAILIDEAQDFGNVFLELVVQLVHPDRGGLTLALDLSQNIRGRPPIEPQLLPQSMKVFRLEHSYRSTTSIRNFADTFGNRQNVAKSEPLDDGQEPVRLVWAESEVECVKMVVSESIRLIRMVGFKPFEIMVVSFSANQRLQIKTLFLEHGVSTTVPGKVAETTGVLLASPEIAKGHEASCVFLLGWDGDSDLIETPENDIRRYVASSRAADMLYVVYSSQQVPSKLTGSCNAVKQLWPDDFQIAM